MTPERWHRITALFEAALGLDPAPREAWLRAACGVDEELRREVEHLLAGDERATRDGFLAPPPASDPFDDPSTTSWPRHAEDHPAAASRWQTPPRDASQANPVGFTPRQAIAPLAMPSTVSEPPELVRARLRELPMVYILIHAASILWRRAVLGPGDPLIARADTVVLLVLVALIALLWSPWPIRLATLKGLELGMVGLLGGFFAFSEYRLILAFSLRGDSTWRK
jgi:serine/threonine-protein kinase